MSSPEDNLTTFIAGCAVLFCCSTLASAGGIGGGGLNVPILIVLFGYDYNVAVVISLFGVMGNVLIQVCINWTRRHPAKPSRPLIYWDIILIMEPAQLGGSNLGVILAKILPSSILEIVAICVLSFAVYRTVKKGNHLWELETEELNKLDNQEPLEEEREVSLYEATGIDYPANHRSTFSLSADGVNPLSSKLEVEQPAVAEQQIAEIGGLPKIEYPWTIICLLVASWAFYAVLVVTMSQMETCSVTYWSTFAASYPCLIAICIYVVSYVQVKQMNNKDTLLDGDVDCSVVDYTPAVAAFSIGCLSSLLGLGGGELMGPYLLGMKIMPMVSSASTAVMSFASSSSSVLHHIVLGDVPASAAGIICCVGAVGGFCGRKGAIKITKMFGRPSILIFVLASILVISALILMEEVVFKKFQYTLSSACD